MIKIPYSSNKELPEQVKKLPEKAKTIFRKTFNSALEQYKDEQQAMKVAWSAVKKTYKKDDDGNWVKKSAMIVKKTDEDLNYTLGIVYEPNTPDLQGDFAEPKDIRKAAWDYVVSIQKNVEHAQKAYEALEEISKFANGESDELRLDITFLEKKIEKRVGDMHSDFGEDYGYVVESYIAPVDMEIGEETVKKGTWLLGVVWSDEMFSKIKSGDRLGYSMGGRGKRKPVGGEDDE